MQHGQSTEGDGQKDCDDREDGRGTPATADRPDTLFHISLSEGDCLDGYGARGRSEEQKGLRVLLPSVHGQILRDTVIAGEFQVADEEEISQPHEGVEPVEREKEEGQRLPEMIAVP